MSTKKIKDLKKGDTFTRAGGIGTQYIVINNTIDECRMCLRIKDNEKILFREEMPVNLIQ